MNSYLMLNSNNRLRHWISHRNSAKLIHNIEEQLLYVQEYWDMKPTVIRSIDVDNSISWPTPWEMIYNGEYCSYSKAYLMEQTLLLLELPNYSKDTLKLLYIENKNEAFIKLILVYDNIYVLNYEYKKIIKFNSIAKNCVIIHEYILKKQYNHYIIK